MGCLLNSVISILCSGVCVYIFLFRNHGNATLNLAVATNGTNPVVRENKGSLGFSRAFLIHQKWTGVLNCACKLIRSSLLLPTAHVDSIAQELR